MQKCIEPFPTALRRVSRVLHQHRQRYRTWILEDLVLAYLPVPKAASSSIRQILYDQVQSTQQGFHDLGSEQTRSLIKKRFRHALTASQVRALQPRLHLFTFVRNPLDRLYSCYRDKVVNAQRRREECTLAPYGIHFGIDFESFVQAVAEIPDAQSDQHFRSQHCFVCHKGELLVDFVGYVESMEADWGQIQQRAPLPQVGHQKRASGAPAATAQLPLRKKAAKQALERYATDIELFGYRTEIEQALSEMT